MLLNRLDEGVSKYFITTLIKKCVRIQMAISCIENMTKKSLEHKAECETDAKHLTISKVHVLCDHLESWSEYLDASKTKVT